MATERLPSLFLIRREVNGESANSKHYALVATTYVRPPISLQEHPTCTLVEHPETVLQGGHWDMISNGDRIAKWHPVQLYRPSHRQGATHFHNTEFMIGMKVWKQADGSVIPCIGIKNSTVALPSDFYSIGRNTRSARFSVRIDPWSTSRPTQVLPIETQVLPVETHEQYTLVPQEQPLSNQTPSKFPQHLVNMIVEAAIDKGTNCPISFDPLTKTSARLTPCGHLVSHPAVECWLSSAHSCPVCRQDLQMEALMKWTA